MEEPQGCRDPLFFINEGCFSTLTRSLIFTSENFRSKLYNTIVGYYTIDFPYLSLLRGSKSHFINFSNYMWLDTEMSQAA